MIVMDFPHPLTPEAAIRRFLLMVQIAAVAVLPTRLAAARKSWRYLD